MELRDYITLPIDEFAVRAGLGATTIRHMVKDGRLEAVRIGSKRVLVVVESYYRLLDKQQREGMPDYAGVAAAHEARRKQIAEGNRKPGPGARAEARQAGRDDALLEELGL